MPGGKRHWYCCGECGTRQMIPNRELIRASKPRCKACGSLYLTPSTAADEAHHRHDQAMAEQERKTEWGASK